MPPLAASGARGNAAPPPCAVRLHPHPVRARRRGVQSRGQTPSPGLHAELFAEPGLQEALPSAEGDPTTTGEVVRNARLDLSEHLSDGHVGPTRGAPTVWVATEDAPFRTSFRSGNRVMSGWWKTEGLDSPWRKIMARIPWPSTAVNVSILCRRPVQRVAYFWRGRGTERGEGGAGPHRAAHLSRGPGLPYPPPRYFSLPANATERRRGPTRTLCSWFERVEKWAATDTCFSPGRSDDQSNRTWVMTKF